MKNMKLQDIKLIIGLGNPGEEYAGAYHNVGFLFISWLMKHETWSMKHKLFLASKFIIPNSLFIIHFIKPKTFMNESGTTVKEALKYFKAKPEEILIVHDDSDIELGKYKISFGRGSAGHNGVESIIKALGTKNFWRLRIGIRPPIRVNPHQISVNPRTKASAFVLKKINKKDLEILEKVFDEVAKNVL